MNIENYQHLNCDSVIDFMVEFNRRKKEDHHLAGADLPFQLKLGFVDHTTLEHITLGISKLKHAEPYLKQEVLDAFKNAEIKKVYFNHPLP